MSLLKRGLEVQKRGKRKRTDCFRPSSLFAIEQREPFGDREATKTRRGERSRPRQEDQPKHVVGRTIRFTSRSLDLRAVMITPDILSDS